MATQVSCVRLLAHIRRELPGKTRKRAAVGHSEPEFESPGDALQFPTLMHTRD